MFFIWENNVDWQEKWGRHRLLYFLVLALRNKTDGVREQRTESKAGHAQQEFTIALSVSSLASNWEKYVSGTCLPNWLFLLFDSRSSVSVNHTKTTTEQLKSHGQKHLMQQSAGATHFTQWKPDKSPAVETPLTFFQGVCMVLKSIKKW